ncbi:hypothetical protein M0Q28_05410 [Patescibacteria group bacterium]|jgi:hypothetical protein|nr:hypothetical protein [Patescibacteria group bacterium]
MESGSLFLVTLLVNVTRKRTGVADQARFRAVVRAASEAEARQRMKPIADELGASFDLEPIELLDDVAALAPSLRRFCKTHSFDLAVDGRRVESNA